MKKPDSSVFTSKKALRTACIALLVLAAVGIALFMTVGPGASTETEGSTTAVVLYSVNDDATDLTGDSAAQTVYDAMGKSCTGEITSTSDSGVVTLVLSFSYDTEITTDDIETALGDKYTDITIQSSSVYSTEPTFDKGSFWGLLVILGVAAFLMFLAMVIFGVGAANSVLYALKALLTSLAAFGLMVICRIPRVSRIFPMAIAVFVISCSIFWIMDRDFSISRQSSTRKKKSASENAFAESWYSVFSSSTLWLIIGGIAGALICIIIGSTEAAVTCAAVFLSLIVCSLSAFPMFGLYSRE